MSNHILRFRIFDFLARFSEIFEISKNYVKEKIFLHWKKKLWIFDLAQLSENFFFLQKKKFGV